MNDIYHLLLRDKLMTKVQALPFFTGHNFHFHTNKSVQIQPQNIPFAGVYFIEKVDLPDGDGNVGEVRFRSTVRYGISVIVQNNDPAAAENKLGEAMQAIGTLFADPTFYNWEKVGRSGEVAVQSFNRGSTTHQFGSVGENNEYPIAELRFDLNCDLGVITYPPTVDDRFETMHVTTQYPANDAYAPPVISEWEILQGWEIPTKMKITSQLMVNATII